MAGVRQYESGANWREAGLIESKGCGSAMRTAPVGMLYGLDDDRLRMVAEASSLITHRHPAAVAATVAAAYLIRLALDDVLVNAYMGRVMAYCDGISEEFDRAILRIGHVLGWGDEVAAMDHIGQGWTGEEAVALALYCVLKYPDDYVACMRRAANSSGDSDSIACIAGGIMGARIGLGAIPAAWIARCENRDYLLELGERLARVSP
jgi:ADP-ribosylglycohydrolase